MDPKVSQRAMKNHNPEPRLHGVAVPDKASLQTCLEDKVAMSARASSALSDESTIEAAKQENFRPPIFSFPSITKYYSIQPAVKPPATVAMASAVVSSSPLRAKDLAINAPESGATNISHHLLESPVHEHQRPHPPSQVSMNKKSTKPPMTPKRYTADGIEDMPSPPKNVYGFSSRVFSRMDFIEQRNQEDDPLPIRNQKRDLPSSDSESEFEDSDTEEDVDDTTSEGEEPSAQKFQKSQPQFQRNANIAHHSALSPPEAADIASNSALHLTNPDESDSDMSDGYAPCSPSSDPIRARQPHNPFPQSNHPDFLPPRGIIPAHSNDQLMPPMVFGVLGKTISTPKKKLEERSKVRTEPRNMEVRMVFSSSTVTPGINPLARIPGEMELWARGAFYDDPLKNATSALADAAGSGNNLATTNSCDECGGQCGSCGGEMIKQVRKRKRTSGGEDEGRRKVKEPKRRTLERLPQRPVRAYVWKTPAKNRGNKKIKQKAKTNMTISKREADETGE